MLHADLPQLSYNSAMTERVSFWTVFKHEDGMLVTRQNTKVGAVAFGPNVGIGRGVSFGGIDLFQYLGRDLQIERSGDVITVRGIFT